MRGTPAHPHATSIFSSRTEAGHPPRRRPGGRPLRRRIEREKSTAAATECDLSNGRAHAAGRHLQLEQPLAPSIPISIYYPCMRRPRLCGVPSTCDPPRPAPRRARPCGSRTQHTDVDVAAFTGSRNAAPRTLKRAATNGAPDYVRVTWRRASCP
jgi:hypothetical protein